MQHQPRILVIDDAPEIHDLLRVRLAQEPWRLLHALTAEEGLALACRHHPDMILLDVGLGDSSGFTVLARLKHLPELASIPVVFLTAENETLSKVRALDIGAVDYICKPFDPIEVRARLRAALRSKQHQDQLLDQVRHDPLTGAFNRRELDLCLASILGLDNGNRLPVSLAMVDLDHFKSINDKFGHPAGDAVLRAVAARLRGGVRGQDLVCRYGGEEFAVVFAATDRDSAAAICRRILGAIAESPIAAADLEITATVSMGLSCSDDFDVAAPSPSQLLEAADRALYCAKRQGRNRLALHTDDASASASR